MNAYETAEQKVIPAVLLYAFYQGKILMIHAKAKDGLPGKWNGLGGKLELGESIKDAAVREFYEESGCKTDKKEWRWLGELFFPNFKSHKKEDWWVNVFTIELSPVQAASIRTLDPSLPEGTLDWLAPDQILNLDLWDGDRVFLPYVFKLTPFQGTFFYEAGHCVRHELEAVTLASQ